MYKVMKKFALIIILMIISSVAVLAQVPPPPPADAGAGNSGPVGHNAPIGNGLTIMLVMCAAYAAKKVLDARKNPDPENEDS